MIRFVILFVLGFPAIIGAADLSLVDAIEARDGSATQVALKSATKTSINAAQVDGMTALHWACFHDDAALVARLLKAGANVNVTNRYEVTPLALACTNGNARIARDLLKAGADPNSELRGGETPLLTASRVGSADIVGQLIKAGADIDERERSGQTAMMWAAAAGHADVVQTLIDAGADFRKPLKSGFTPLFFACREGRASVVQALLKAGADINQKMAPKSDGGKRPRKGTTPLIMAVENGHFELAAELLEAGADPNDQSSGFTALHVLTWVRKPNRGDGPDGEPSPQGSGQLSSLDFVRVLVKHGAKLDTRLKNGKSGRGRMHHKGATAFLFAAKTADVPLLKLLMELGADPALSNVDDCTPLMAAAGIGTIAPREEAGTESEAVDAVKLLLSHGGHINHTDKNGETAMHGAAYKSFPKVARLLANRGAKIDVWNRKNKYGWTPCLIAEGHRPGNFKPSFETLAMIHTLMRENGIQPPKPTPRKKRKGY